MVILYLVSSFLSALIFSVLAVRARNNGGSGAVWIVLSVLAAIFFGTIAYSLVITSSPTHDRGWYYMGATTLVSNLLALVILTRTLLAGKKPLDTTWPERN
jgi:hypothetical protein